MFCKNRNSVPRMKESKYKDHKTKYENKESKIEVQCLPDEEARTGDERSSNGEHELRG